MSGFLDSSPTLEVSVENVLLGRRYPATGEVLAVLDTGYGGFLGVPEDVFDDLALGDFEPLKKTLILANGNRIESKGTYGRLRVKQAGASVEGYIETWPGLDELLIGSEAMSSFRLDLDYCLRRLSVQKCGRTKRS